MTTPAPDWANALPHRPPAELNDAAQRLERHGFTPSTARAALTDLGAALGAALLRAPEDPDWAAPYGGPAGAAAIAHEIEGFSRFAARRAAYLRTDAFNVLLGDGTTTQAQLARDVGITRQALNKALKYPSPLRGLVADLTEGSL